MLGLAFGLTVAATWKLLLFDHRFVPASRDYLSEIRAEAELPPFDQSSENTGFRLTNPVLDSGPREKKGQRPYQLLNRERFNAALAAGLIDPSRIEIEAPSVPGLNQPTEHWLTLNSPGDSRQTPPAGLDSGCPPLTASAERSTDSAAANPTKPIDAISTTAKTMDRTVPTSWRQSVENAPDGMTPPWPRRQAVQIVRNKPVTIGLLVRTENGSQKSTAVPENQHRRNASSSGGPDDSSADPAIDHSPSRELSENIQRFASDLRD